MTGPRYQRPKETIAIVENDPAPLYKARRELPGQQPAPAPEPDRIDTVAARPLPPPPPPVSEAGPGAMDPFTLLSDDDAS